ncbi:MAG TPA: DUF192 domain-containing protein [Coriobacteriia bacterium]|nr:DUF192 domain-containing protein [Coriobacteriia bacterium]
MKIELAYRWPDRMFGLLRKGVCENGETLVIAPCNSIHTFGMRQVIDIAFLDRWGCVLKSIEALPPRKFAFCKGAVCVLERRSLGRVPMKTDHAAGARQRTAWFAKGEHVELSNSELGEET